MPQPVFVRKVLAAGAATLLTLGLAACSSGSATNTASSTPTSSSPSVTSSDGSVTLLAVPGWTYTAPPASVSQLFTSMASGDTVGGIDAQKATKDGQDLFAVLIQFSGKTGQMIDEQPAKVLPRMGKAFGSVFGASGGGSKVTVVNGRSVMTFDGPTIDLSIAGVGNGQMLEVIGKSPAPVNDFTTAYLDQLG
jgi:hypothetical protein